MSFNRRAPLPLRKGFGSFGADELSDSSGNSGARGLLKVIAASKTSGALNLSNRQLQEVPPDVFQLPENDDSIKWWEAVDLTKLDLSHNEISQLPAQLWELSGLVTLLLSHNKLQQVPPGMASLQSLCMLNLSDNPTLGPTLPDDLAALPSLATLHCNNCGLQSLPDALGGRQQPKLSALSVSGNALTHLPHGLACAGALVVLKASNNQLSQLQGSMVKGWTALKELDVAHNKLEVLPAELAKLPALSQLDARNNQLSQLPDLGAAAALNELRLGFNKISSLPASLGMLASLRTLDLRNNLLEEVPDALCGLQLVLLDLTNNCLRRLPPMLGHMTSLRSIPLDGNPLKLMRRELWAGPVSALLQHLRDQEKQDSLAAAQAKSGGTGTSGGQLSMHAAAVSGMVEVVDGAVSLRGRGLNSIPADVWQADSVASLDVSENSLTGDGDNITTGLQQIGSSLRVLAMNSCGLTAWPLAGLPLGCLPALHTLELRFNVLGGCPDSGLAACPRLKSLDLSGAKALQLPEGLFEHTPELEVLTASRAGLAEFPAALLAATSLRRLNLSSNSISAVPPAVTQLARLQELDLQNNQLSNLPPQMGLMGPTLRVLLLEGNCIRAIRRPVLEKGTAAVLEWLQDRIPA